MQRIRDDRELKTRRFRGYIGAMHGRSREVAGFCCLIFEDAFTDEDGNELRSVMQAKQPMLVYGDDDPDGFLASLDAEMESECPRTRYVQAGFEEDYFFLDLPFASLFSDEADGIRDAVPGFLRASENPATPTQEDQIRDFDPLQKFYLYGEESEAAEDVATIFFDVLGLSAGETLYATAFSASGSSWENGEAF